jgi:hypothetical protein
MILLSFSGLPEILSSCLTLPLRCSAAQPSRQPAMIVSPLIRLDLRTNAGGQDVGRRISWIVEIASGLVRRA